MKPSTLRLIGACLLGALTMPAIWAVFYATFFLFR